MKKFIILIVLFFCFIFITLNTYVSATFTDISSNVFRLHVIANSNSSEDQNLKFLVRDAVIEYFNSLNLSSCDKSNMTIILNNNYDTLYNICNSIILENGYNYPITISIGNSYFPTKTYGDISFPEGYYDCIKIKIGNAYGENWWCSLFPPLCFSDINNGVVEDSGKENLKENLSEEEYLLLSSGSTDIKFKFKIIELFNSLKATI